MLKKERLVRFDWAIKHILRDKANFDILEGFLSAVLREEVSVIQILESESDRQQEHLKYNRVDILIKDSQGRHLIIEVQNQYESDYLSTTLKTSLHRLLFGASRVIIDTLKLGEPYRQIAKVISISILYFNLGSGDDYVYYGSTKFLGLHTKHPLQLRKREQSNAHFYLREVDEEKEIFPEYYLIQVERFENVINSSLDEWIYMLKNEKVRDDFTARNIDQAKKKLSVLRMGEKERKRYESYLMSLASERDIMESAHQEGLAEGLKKGLEEGRKEGLEEGRKEGLEEGLHKGLEEGRKEGLEEGKKKGRLETARKMLAKGYTPGEIAEVTGLTVEDILDFIGDK